MLEKLEKGEKYNPEKLYNGNRFCICTKRNILYGIPKQRLGEYARMVYPGLLLNKKKLNFKIITLPFAGLRVLY